MASSVSMCRPFISAITSLAARRARSNAPMIRSRPMANCWRCCLAASRRRATSATTFSRYSRDSSTISRPCWRADTSSVSLSRAAWSRTRLASSSASSRTLAASSCASRTSRVEDSSAFARICAADSRAVVNTRAVSSPSKLVIVSSSSAVISTARGTRAAMISRSRNRSRSCERASSAATMRRKSRTSDGSNPRREVPKCADETAAGDDGSGWENETAMTSQYVRRDVDSRRVATRCNPRPASRSPAHCRPGWRARRAPRRRWRPGRLCRHRGCAAPDPTGSVFGRPGR